MILVMTVIGGTGNLLASVLARPSTFCWATGCHAVAALAAAAGRGADGCELWMQRGLWGLGEPMGAAAAPQTRSLARPPPSNGVPAKGDHRTHPAEAQSVAEKHYGKFVALGGVDLKVRANTVHSVIGPNGAGKTTLFHMLTGTKAVSGGRIPFDGRDDARADHRRVRRGMARLLQVTSLFLTLPVRENLRLAAQGVAPAKALDCWHMTPTGRAPAPRPWPRCWSAWASRATPPRRPATCRTASSGGWKWAWPWLRNRRPSSWTAHVRHGH